MIKVCCPVYPPEIRAVFRRWAWHGLESIEDKADSCQGGTGEADFTGGYSEKTFSDAFEIASKKTGVGGSRSEQQIIL